MEKNHARGNFIGKIENAFSLALVALILFYAVTLDIERGKYTVLFLGLSYALILLKIMRGGSFLRLKGLPLSAACAILIVAFLAATAYLYVEYVPMITDRAGAYSRMDVLAGAAIFIPLCLVILPEAGASMFVLICIFVLYFLFGNYVPGVFGHSGFSIRRTFEEMILGFDGVYGIVLLTISTWVAIFLVYAGIIQGFGALEVIVKGCTLIFGRKKALVPQVPIVCSLIFGTFSGSATANAAGVGSFTIQIMKRFGLPPHIAGAIESVASSGGQIMPPMMGATAFLIASFLGLSYLHVAAVAFIPAFLFYIILAFSVYLRTAAHIDVELGGLIEERSFTRKDWLELLPLVVSIGYLFLRLILLVPMMTACMEGIFAFLAAQLLLEIYRGMHKESVPAIIIGFVRKLCGGMCKTAPGVASIGLIGACMGLIVRVLTVTGLGPKLSAIIVDWSGGSLAVLLLFTLILSILFGMAVSTIAVYILTTFVVSPAFTAMGVPAISTHFMIMYLGCMSFITPPVAPAALVAASIAGSSFMKTAWSAVNLGLPLFLLGITFVYHPALLIWSWGTPAAIVLSAVGLMGVACALHLPASRGAFDARSILERGAGFVCGCGAMFVSNSRVSFLFAAVTAAWIVYRLRTRNSAFAAAQPMAPTAVERN